VAGHRVGFDTARLQQRDQARAQREQARLGVQGLVGLVFWRFGDRDA
jgi:hypothetical protein